MELKVWVEGIQRIVCGVTENTNCQDVVYALAHATGKTGRFTLIERWRNNERLLSPQDYPLRILLKWGEYASDVQFILQHSQTQDRQHVDGTKSPDKSKELKKSLTFAGGSPEGLKNATELAKVLGVKKPQDENLSNSPSKREVPPYREPPGLITNNQTTNTSSQQRALPPYREPPPPTKSNTPTPNSMIVQANCKILKPTRKSNNSNSSPLQQQHLASPTTDSTSIHEAVLCNSQYRDLVRLVNYQREKLSAQQSELTKFDAEIIYWESKAKEQQHQLEFMCQEKTKMETATRQNEEHLRALLHAEADFELVRQQEKTLKSEISLIRSKLANCETELLQCKNKIRILIEELQSEQLAALRETDERQHLERALAHEVERLHQEIVEARQTTDVSSVLSDQLHRELSTLEHAVHDRKRQLEQLLAEIKEANLQSLAIAPPDEFKHLVEPGLTRKMVGSPRQLETAVPTSKNPHGVWV